MASSNQGGSILSFLIIGGVLTVLLVGGAYAVQRQVANSTATPATPAATTSDEKKVAVEQNKDAANQEAAKKAEAQKEAAKQEAAKKETAKPAAPTQVAPPVATELPKTGLAESVSSILGLGLLTGVATAYIRSRSRTATL